MLSLFLHTREGQSNPPEIGKKIASKANRDGIAERCAAPAVHKTLALLTYYDELFKFKDLERSLLKTAKHHNASTLDLLQTIPGIGKILSLVLRYEIHQIERFPRGPFPKPPPCSSGTPLIHTAGNFASFL
jgi:transposase